LEKTISILGKSKSNDSWKYVNGTIPKRKEPPEAVTTWESNDTKSDAPENVDFAENEKR
jgi:hypothetical protein